MPYPDATFDLVIWDALAVNGIPRVMNEAVRSLVPGDEPLFIERVPHGYHNVGRIRADLSAAGFAAVDVETLSAIGHADSAFDVARGFLQGTPMSAEFENGDQLAQAIDVVGQALRTEFGDGGDAITGESTAHFVIAR